MANQFSELFSRLVTELTTTMTPGYTGLHVSARHWDPGKLPAFDRYAVIVSPSPNNTIQEIVKAVRNFQYVVNIDTYLLVKNFDDSNSLFGQSPPNKGLFEMIEDFKETVRGTTLTGLLDKTYSEPGGPVSIEYAASSGFDSGEHSFIRRARIPCTFRLQTFCVNIAP